jgi:hypothetical protein
MLRICLERMYEISELKWEGKKRRLAVCKRDRIKNYRLFYDGVKDYLSNLSFIFTSHNQIKNRINRRKVQGTLYLLFFAVFFPYDSVYPHISLYRHHLYSLELGLNKLLWHIRIVLLLVSLKKATDLRASWYFHFLVFLLFSQNFAWKRQKLPNNTVLYTESFHVSWFRLDLHILSIKLSWSTYIGIYFKKLPGLSLKSILLTDNLKTFKDPHRLKMSYLNRTVDCPSWLSRGSYRLQLTLCN